MKQEASKPARSILRPLFIALLILVALLLGVTWLPVRQAGEAWRRGKNAEAIATSQRWLGFRVWRTQHRQILAAAYLSVGNLAAARPHLAVLSGGRVLLPAIPKDEVARRLFGRGRYGEFLAYDSASRELLRDRRDVVKLYRAAAHAAAGRFTLAEGLLTSIDSDDAGPDRVAALRKTIGERKSGTYPVVFDRTGGTIASMQLARQNVTPASSDFAALVEREAGRLTFESYLRSAGDAGTLETTLDPAVQKAAMTALDGHRGSIVVIDPARSEILAVASSAGRGNLQNLAFEQQVEPGSVVKVLTFLAALNEGFDLRTIFPYHCRGDLLIDGRHFGDWLPQGHGPLDSIDEALAQSCNIVFADIGIRLGYDKLRKAMTAAGFDGGANLALFSIPLGRTIPPVFNKYETAFYAIGLEHASTNSLHLAMIAAAIANGGVTKTPRLLRARRSIVGEVLAEPSRIVETRIATPEAAAAVRRAMVAVVTHPRGTGRRAAIDGLALALKTGTAGEQEAGLNALILGFAPAESPKIAFALIAEDAGPAEYAGAKIVRDLLVALRGRL